LIKYLHQFQYLFTSNARFFETTEHFFKEVDLAQIKHQVLLIKGARSFHFEQITKNYYALDKEGRQQLRQASIQINEISAIDTSNSVINYQNSFEKVAHKLKVIQTKEGWKVDLKYSYTPEL
jgi:hypothetical protein